MDLRFVRYSLGDVAGVLKGGMNDRTGQLGGTRNFVGLFDLRENLRLADNETVETRRDREEMLDGLRVGTVLEMLVVVGRALMVKVEDELSQEPDVGNASFVGPGRIKLNSIARAQEHRLDAWAVTFERTKRLPCLLGGKGETLAEMQRRVMVAATNHVQLHPDAIFSPKWILLPRTGKTPS